MTTGKHAPNFLKKPISLQTLHINLCSDDSLSNKKSCSSYWWSMECSHVEMLLKDFLSPLQLMSTDLLRSQTAIKWKMKALGIKFNFVFHFPMHQVRQLLLKPSLKCNTAQKGLTIHFWFVFLKYLLKNKTLYLSFTRWFVCRSKTMPLHAAAV